MSTETVSPEVLESTRKNGALIESEILRRLSDVGQSVAAVRMGVSESTVSRMAQDLAKVCHFLSAIGMQVNSLDSMVISQEELNGLRAMAYEYLRAQREKDRRG